ncbi:MAG TPA: rod shape-determining protein MreD [Gammaproteobacteria bacterium]|nr:rod shape-determining protein MreD [Gammaproteobacteria bacterium]
MAVINHATHTNARWVILVTFIVAFILASHPLPAWAEYYRPQWITLVLIYWCLAIPHRVNIGTAWVVGIFTDVLQGTLLGLHALGLILVALITLRLHRRIRVFPIWQQALSILLLTLLERLVTLWGKGFTTGTAPDDWRYWLPALTSTLLWPWVFIILRDARRSFNVK